MKNEVLLKFLCHKHRCGSRGDCGLGIEGGLLEGPAGAQVVAI